jgi:hypothetical protein
MSEAVLKIVALVLQYIERLVLDLLSGPAAGGQFDDSVGTDRQIDDEAVAVGDLALGIDDLDFEPVYFSASRPSRNSTSYSQR